MLRWALTGEDASKVTATGNAAHNLKAVYETGTVTIEGKVDRINNIYDLEGNGWEWTAEVNNVNHHNIRGSSCNVSCAPSNRDGNYPTSTSNTCSSRSVLYLK